MAVPVFLQLTLWRLLMDASRSIQMTDLALEGLETSAQVVVWKLWGATCCSAIKMASSLVLEYAKNCFPLTMQIHTQTAPRG